MVQPTVIIASPTFEAGQYIAAHLLDQTPEIQISIQESLSRTRAFQQKYPIAAIIVAEGSPLTRELEKIAPIITYDTNEDMFQFPDKVKMQLSIFPLDNSFQGFASI